MSSNIHTRLPKGRNWLEHLEMLGAIRQSAASLYSRKKAKDYFSDFFNGYAVLGISKKTETYNEALAIIQESGLPNSLLVDNELMPGYARINVSTQRSIGSMEFVQQVVEENEVRLKTIPISDNQIQSLKKVCTMYETDEKQLEQVKKLFMSKWNEHPHLKMLSEWWDSISVPFHILLVGHALARTNARRLDTSIPELKDPGI